MRGKRPTKRYILKLNIKHRPAPIFTFDVQSCNIVPQFDEWLLRQCCHFIVPQADHPQMRHPIKRSSFYVAQLIVIQLWTADESVEKKNEPDEFRLI